MLRLRAPAGSIRRSRLGLVLGPVAVVAATGVLSGCVAEVDQISTTCTNPATLNDGFVADRAAFFRVATQPSPTDSRTTWVCFRVKAGDTDTAGRVDVDTGAGATLGDVGLDGSSRACATGPDNLIPPPHPLEEGAVGDIPLYLDSYAGPSGAWLCVEVGSTKGRVAIPIPAVDLPGATVRSDRAAGTPQDTTPPPAGKASTACAAGTYGTPSELINTHLGGRDLFLYTVRPSQTQLHVCARLQGAQSGGVRLSVNAAPNQVVDIQQSADTTPCTTNVVTLSNPPASIKTTPVGQTPPSICISGTRYTVVTGPVPPVVSWAVDS